MKLALKGEEDREFLDAGGCVWGEEAAAAAITLEEAVILAPVAADGGAKDPAVGVMELWLPLLLVLLLLRASTRALSSLRVCSDSPPVPESQSLVE